MTRSIILQPVRGQASAVFRNRGRMSMRFSNSGLRAVVSGLGLALGCSGCGGGLQEGIPSEIDPNKPSTQVKGMLEAAKQAQLASTEKAASKVKKAQAGGSYKNLP